MNDFFMAPDVAAKRNNLSPEEDAAFARTMLAYSGLPAIGDSERVYSNITPDWGVAIDIHRDTMGGSLRVSDIIVFRRMHAERWTPSRTVPRSRAARGSVELAARLAGARRSHLRGEWLAVLAGSPEDGVNPSSRQQMTLALGFLFASLRFRLKDAIRPMWRPVDWALRVPSRTIAVIAALVGCQAIYIVRGNGLSALVADVWEPCGIAGAALFTLTQWLRRVRGIELASHDQEPTDE
jgi:hypothetical protein